MSSRWLYSLALLAPPHPLLQLEPFTPIFIFLSNICSKPLDPASSTGVNCASPVVAPPNADHEGIEPDGLGLAQRSGFDIIEQKLR